MKLILITVLVFSLCGCYKEEIPKSPQTQAEIFKEMESNANGVCFGNEVGRFIQIHVTGNPQIIILDTKLGNVYALEHTNLTWIRITSPLAFQK